MLNHDLYDRSGSEISFERWCLLFGDTRYQMLKKTTVVGVTVSTVWLGIDLGLDGEPLIFETMLFGLGREECYRYGSEEAALTHHDELAAELRLLASVASEE